MQEHEVRELFERLRRGHGPGDGVPGPPRGLRAWSSPSRASGWTATACAGSRRPSRAAGAQDPAAPRDRQRRRLVRRERHPLPRRQGLPRRLRVEFRDGKIWSETRYYAEPFEVPEWRASWSRPVIEEPVAG